MNLPPGYDGSAFRHDTGERRSFANDDAVAYPTETKVHSPGQWERHSRGTTDLPVQDSAGEAQVRSGLPQADPQESDFSAVNFRKVGSPQVDSFLSGMLDSLGKEEWLLLFLLLLLLADGSDAWELILLLAVLLAVR